MTELTDKIRATLAELHAELAAAEPLDNDARALLARTAAEIEAKLQTASDAAGDDDEAGEGEAAEALPSRLTEAAQTFEASHPTISGILGSLANALSQLGI